MIDKERIEAEAQLFFTWPDPARKDFVTLASCVIFAHVIAEMARAAEHARCSTAVSDAERARDSAAQVRDAALAALHEVDRLAGHDDALTEWRERWAHLWEPVAGQLDSGVRRVSEAKE